MLLKVSSPDYGPILFLFFLHPFFMLSTVCFTTSFILHPAYTQSRHSSTLSYVAVHTIKYKYKFSCSSSPFRHFRKKNGPSSPWMPLPILFPPVSINTSFISSSDETVSILKMLCLNIQHFISFSI